MADDAAIPASIARHPDPTRRYLKLPEAARRAGVTRKVMQHHLTARTPAAGWVDTSGQRVKGYIYEDAVPAPPEELIAELTARVERLDRRLEEQRAAEDAGELADLRARVVRAEAINALLVEAYELQESANQRFRQALTLHTTPGHVGDLRA